MKKSAFPRDIGAWKRSVKLDLCGQLQKNQLFA